jgi:hypothetical protein
MAEGYEQFYRTWCYSGRSVSGADGWKIRAKSEKLALPEAEGLADLANYWSPTEFSREFLPGRRLALFRRPEDCVLANGVPVAGLVGGRGGVSFEHVVVGLPKGFSAFDAIKLWRASIWQIQDGGFAPQLPKFAWDRDSDWTGFQPAQSVPGEGDSAVVMELLNRSEVVSWSSYMLRACLAAATGAVDKVFIAGTDDSIARLLFIALYCLPERFRRNLTFSTHENPKATKGVQIVGVTTFEGGETDFPRFCYDGRYCAINTFNGNKSETLAISIFADSAIQWLLAGQFGLLENVRRGFDALDSADNPDVGELELLAQNPPLGDDAPLDTEGYLKLLGSPAIGHAMLCNRAELIAIMNLARNEEGFKDSVVGQLSTWLPKHVTASKEFPSALADIALEQIQAGKLFEEVTWLAEFCRGVDGNLELPFWERLMLLFQARLNQGAGSKSPLPALDTRLRLIEVWHHWHQLPEQFAGDPFGEVVSSWLQVASRDLSAVLNSSLKDNLKQLTLTLWLNVKNPGEFQAVIKELRDDNNYRDLLTGHLAGLFKVRPDALRAFPASLAVVGVEEIRVDSIFSKVTWLADLARDVSPMLNVHFWEELLVVCETLVSRPETGQPLFPKLETRIEVMERWERHTKGKAGILKGVIAGTWLRVGPQELLLVLISGLSTELQLESVRLCLTGTQPINQPMGDQIIGLIGNNRKLTKDVFFGIPQWQRGATIARVPEMCWMKLLESQTAQLQLGDFLDDGIVETVAFWVNRVPKAVPPPMRALFSFGQFFKSPGAFQTVGTIAPELLHPDFWTRRYDRTAAATGAVDKLLNRGDLADFERALESFGDRRLTNSPVDFLELAYVRVQNNAVKCRDASLQRLLEVLGLILQEWKTPASRKDNGTSSEAIANKLTAEEYAVLGRVGMRYLPGSSLLKSPTGQQVIELLHAQSHLLGPMQNAWVQKIYTLFQVCNATEFQSEMIETLAKAYLALDKEADTDIRAEINAMLLKLVAEKPTALQLALVAFVNSVYASNENLFLKGFMPGLMDNLIKLERGNESGAVAEKFVLFCIEGCFLTGTNGNFADRRSQEMAIWLDRFSKSLTSKSMKRVNQSAQKWEESSRNRWYQVSGYKEKWWQTRNAKRVLWFFIGVVLLLIVIVFGSVYLWHKHQQATQDKLDMHAKSAKNITSGTNQITGAGGSEK